MCLETARQAIDIAIQHSEDKNMGIIFFGGEPLLLPELIEDIIYYCRHIEKKQNFKFHYKITTNGILLNEETLTRLLKNEIMVALSHDGIQLVHDSQRVFPDGRGSFEVLDEVINLLLDSQPYAPVLCVTTPENVNHYYECIKYLLDRGFKYIISSLNYAGRWNDSSIKVLEKQYKKLARLYVNLTLKEEKFYLSMLEKKIASRIHPEYSISCKAGRRQISVDPEGIFYPCVQFVGREEYEIGDIYSGLNFKKQEKIFCLNEEDKEDCLGCVLNRRCHNKCGCLNLQTTGSLRRVPAILCEQQRLLIPIVDKAASQLFKLRSPMFIQKHYNELYPVISFLEDLMV
jgi:uncharacterized protein